MKDNQKGFVHLEIIAIVMTVAVIAMVGIILFQRHRASGGQASEQGYSSNCEITAEMKSRGIYDVPCLVWFTLEGPPYTERSQVEKIVTAAGGKIEESETYAENGIYTVRVKPGDEEKASQYIKAQPGIVDATQVSCCIGPNAN